jgi:hypothetical protein
VTRAETVAIALGLPLLFEHQERAALHGHAECRDVCGIHPVASAHDASPFKESKYILDRTCAAGPELSSHLCCDRGDVLGALGAVVRHIELGQLHMRLQERGYVAKQVRDGQDLPASSRGDRAQ